MHETRTQGHYVSSYKEGCKYSYKGSIENHDKVGT